MDFRSSRQLYSRARQWILVCALTAATPVLAATITVDSTGDTIAVDGHVTLREAITSINNGFDVNLDVTASRGQGTYGIGDTINFSIGTGVQVIQPAINLPPVGVPVILDATSQPGYAGTPLIVIDGSGPGTVAFTALTICGGNSVVRGFNIRNWSSGAIDIFACFPHLTAGGNVIAANFIGTDETGTLNRLNHSNISISQGSSPSNTIGGSTPVVTGGSLPPDGNLISGSPTSGIEAISEGNIIRGNFFGTDVTGTKPIGNGTGIQLDIDPFSSSYTLPSQIVGNLISGNGGGIVLQGITSNGRSQIGNIVIQGNLIGTNVNQTAALANGTGISVNHAIGPKVVIGGTSPGARNVISGNGYGIFTQRSSLIVIQGNIIGTGDTGLLNLGNTFDGIALGNLNGLDNLGIALIENITVGRTLLPGPGDIPAAANTIAYSGQYGVNVGVVCLPMTQCPQDQGNSVLGNSIWNNKGLGIHLGNGANNFQAAPVVMGVTPGGNIHATLDSITNRAYRIEMFSNFVCHGAPPNDFGEGRTYLGSMDVLTDGGGHADFFFKPTSPPQPTETIITATATDETGGSTSQFSQCKTAPAVAPIFTSANHVTFFAGSPGGFTVVAVAFPGPLVSVSPGLPASVTFNPATGVLSGTPGVADVGTHVVTFTANNGVGPPVIQSFTLTVAMPITVPGQPAAPTAVAGNMAATVNFAPPLSDGGSPITAYLVLSSPPGGVDLDAGATLIPHVVTGLTNGIAYTFTVTAANAVGDGAASPPSNSVTPTAGLAPMLTHAVSHMVHGAAGTFDLPLY